MTASIRPPSGDYVSAEDYTALERRVQELEQALRCLRNEGYAVLSLAAVAIKESAGFTNLKCFENRLSEATQVLLPAPPDAGGTRP